MYVRVSLPLLSLSPCSRHGPRVLTLGISLAIVKSPTLKGINGERRTFLDPWLGTDVSEMKRFLRMERERERLNEFYTRFYAERDLVSPA